MEFGRDMFSDMDGLQREVERFFNHVVGAKRWSPVLFSPGTWQPLVDVYETPDELVAVIDLAGVKREEVEIVINRNTLTIRGHREGAYRYPRPTYHLMEISCGAFERAIPLPVAVAADEVSATYEDGFLEIVLPKAKRAQSTRVPVRSGGPEEE